MLYDKFERIYLQKRFWPFGLK